MFAERAGSECRYSVSLAMVCVRVGQCHPLAPRSRMPVCRALTRVVYFDNSRDSINFISRENKFTRSRATFMIRVIYEHQTF